MSPIISDRSERAFGWRNKAFEKKRMSYGVITSVHAFDHKQDHGPAFGNRGVFAFGERGTVYCIRHGTVVLANALT